jgi:hypothetical protein
MWSGMDKCFYSRDGCGYFEASDFSRKSVVNHFCAEVLQESNQCLLEFLYVSMATSVVKKYTTSSQHFKSCSKGFSLLTLEIRGILRAKRIVFFNIVLNIRSVKLLIVNHVFFCLCTAAYDAY